MTTIELNVSSIIQIVIISGLTSKSIREVVTHSGPGSVPGPGQASVKRSNTMVAALAPASLSAAQLLAPAAGQSADVPGMRRSHNTGYYSFRDYSPVYGTATLGRAARVHG